MKRFAKKTNAFNPNKPFKILMGGMGEMAALPPLQQIKFFNAVNIAIFALKIKKSIS